MLHWTRQCHPGHSNVTQHGNVTLDTAMSHCAPHCQRTPQCHKEHHNVTKNTTMSQRIPQFHKEHHNFTKNTTISQRTPQCHKEHHNVTVIKTQETQVKGKLKRRRNMFRPTDKYSHKKAWKSDKLIVWFFWTWSNVPGGLRRLKTPNARPSFASPSTRVTWS